MEQKKPQQRKQQAADRSLKIRFRFENHNRKKKSLLRRQRDQHTLTNRFEEFVIRTQSSQFAYRLPQRFHCFLAVVTSQKFFSRNEDNDRKRAIYSLVFSYDYFGSFGSYFFFCRFGTVFLRFVWLFERFNWFVSSLSSERGKKKGAQKKLTNSC